MGLLIGKGGKNIKELERLSNCRLRTVASTECEGMTELHIHSSSNNAEEQEKAAAVCLRAARLVSEEGKTIEEGWRIATNERQKQEQRNATLLEACRLQMAARKLRLVCPEMTMEEASDALRASDFDEDLALDLFYQGAIFAERSEPEQPKDSVEPAQKEDFPILSSPSLEAPAVATWCQKQVAKTIFTRSAPNADDDQTFPSLPTSEAKVFSKSQTAASRKCVSRRAVKTCPSLRTNTRAVASHNGAQMAEKVKDALSSMSRSAPIAEDVEAFPSLPSTKAVNRRCLSERTNKSAATQMTRWQRHSKKE